MTDPMHCSKCGQPHTRCAGHVKNGPRKGQPCMRQPRKGATVCHGCGGAAPQVIAAAERRVARQEIQKVVHATLGDMPDRDIDPAATLQWLINASSAHAHWYLGQIQQLRPDALVWGDTEVRQSDLAGLTVIQKAQVTALLQLYNEERVMLAKFVALALSHGLAEREVRLEEARGALIADVFRAVLAQLELTPDQQSKALTLVPAMLRKAQAGAALN